MSKYGKPSHGDNFNLKSIDAELRTAEAYDQQGHTARSLVREDDVRVVIVSMKKAGRMAEHRAAETAVVQVLSGQVRLHLPDEAIELSAGELLVIAPGVSHDVEAIEESSFLLTLGRLASSRDADGHAE